MSFKKLSSEYINKHSYFTARKDSYQTPSGKIVDPYFVVELPASVVAMALTEDNKVIFVKQYRYPVNEVLIELPGGFIDPGEQPQQAIQRELLEESGHVFESYHYLGITAANPGILNNYTHMFLASGGKKIAAQQLDSNEEIEILFYSLEDVSSMLHHQDIQQSMHALCLFYGLSFLEKNGTLTTTL
ncbi:MAG: NUDIX hydrolase [Ferruginibacter sp.]